MQTKKEPADGVIKCKGWSITRNPNKYSLDNDDDLLAIISIYEKAICIVYSKGRK